MKTKKYIKNKLKSRRRRRKTRQRGGNSMGQIPKGQMPMDMDPPNGPKFPM